MACENGGTVLHDRQRFKCRSGLTLCLQGETHVPVSRNNSVDVFAESLHLKSIFAADLAGAFRIDVNDDGKTSVGDGHIHE
jgi:hypothetical protein